MPILWCRNLTCSFGGISALSSISLDFIPTEIVGIIGPNGAGKTTIINVLTGFLVPNRGSFGLGSRQGEGELTGASPQAIATTGIGRSFQEVRCVRELTVIDNVLLAFPDQTGESLLGAFQRSATAQDRHNLEHARELLRLVGLSEFAGVKVGSLSFGQRKLLSLAGCLASGASFLLLDEPVAGVSPDLRAQIGEVLVQCRAKKTFIIVEHDLQFVRAVANRVILLEDGEVRRDDACSKVLDDPTLLEAYLG